MIRHPTERKTNHKPTRLAAKDPVLWKLPHRKAARAKAETGAGPEVHALVKTVVARIQMSLPPHVDPEDLYSAGLIGLLDAIRNYNPAWAPFRKLCAGAGSRGGVR